MNIEFEMLYDPHKYYFVKISIIYKYMLRYKELNSNCYRLLLYSCI